MSFLHRPTAEPPLPQAATIRGGASRPIYCCERAGERRISNLASYPECDDEQSVVEIMTNSMGGNLTGGCAVQSPGHDELWFRGNCWRR
jgi:hypothetical protein